MEFAPPPQANPVITPTPEVAPVDVPPTPAPPAEMPQQDLPSQSELSDIAQKAASPEDEKKQKRKEKEKTPLTNEEAVTILDTLVAYRNEADRVTDDAQKLQARKNKLQLMMHAMEYDEQEITEVLHEVEQGNNKTTIPFEIKFILSVGKRAEHTTDRGSAVMKHLGQMLAHEVKRLTADQINLGVTNPDEKVDVKTLKTMPAREALRKAMEARGITDAELQTQLINEFIAKCEENDLTATPEDSAEQLLDATLTEEGKKKQKLLKEVDKKLKNPEGLSDKQKQELEDARIWILSSAASTVSFIAEGMTIAEFIDFLTTGSESGGFGRFGSHEDLVHAGKYAIGEHEMKEVFPTGEALIATMEEALLTLSPTEYIGKLPPYNRENSEFQKKNEATGKLEFDQEKYSKWLVDEYLKKLKEDQEHMLAILKKQLITGEQGRKKLGSVHGKDGDLAPDEHNLHKFVFSQEALEFFVEEIHKLKHQEV